MRPKNRTVRGWRPAGGDSRRMGGEVLAPWGMTTLARGERPIAESSASVPAECAMTRSAMVTSRRRAARSSSNTGAWGITLWAVQTSRRPTRRAVLRHSANHHRPARRSGGKRSANGRPKPNVQWRCRTWQPRARHRASSAGSRSRLTVCERVAPPAYPASAPWARIASYRFSWYGLGSRGIAHTRRVVIGGTPCCPRRCTRCRTRRAGTAWARHRWRCRRPPVPASYAGRRWCACRTARRGRRASPG